MMMIATSSGSSHSKLQNHKCVYFVWFKELLCGVTKILAVLKRATEESSSLSVRAAS